MAKKKKSVTQKTVKKAEDTGGLRPGDLAPDFSLLSDQGERVRLKELRGRAVVIYFYPKDLTPGCTQEACDFRDSLAAFNKLRVQVLGVSKDSPDTHAKFKVKHGLNFPLLSDEDGEVCEAYGVWKEKSLYGRKFMGIVRTTFVIDADGRISEVFPRVKVPGHIDTVLASCKGVRA